jgi:hypothetical protein
MNLIQNLSRGPGARFQRNEFTLPVNEGRQTVKPQTLFRNCVGEPFPFGGLPSAY